MGRKIKTEKLWCVVFVGNRAVCRPVYGHAASWAIASKLPGAIRRCYGTLREALAAIEQGPDYLGDVAPPLF